MLDEILVRLTLLLLDLHVDIVVDTSNDDVAEDIECAHTVQHIRIVEWHLLGCLHHHQDDNQVGPAIPVRKKPPSIAAELTVVHS